MSSRSNDSQRLATLAQTISEVAAGHVKMMGVLQQQVADMDDAIDLLERRLLLIQRSPSPYPDTDTITLVDRLCQP
jgi:hypothetical protein